MTIAVAWVRRITDCEELVFTTDSRLSGTAFDFDACPKVLALPRSDCAIAFAGETDHAYPMMHQVAAAFDAHAPLRRRSMDLAAAKTHALKVIDAMGAAIRPSPLVHGHLDQQPSPGAEFLFGGYSWVRKEFLLWTIRYSSQEGRHLAQPARWIGIDTNNGRISLRKRNAPNFRSIGKIAIAGDQAPTALRMLADLIKTKDTEKTLDKLDFEPFEVVRDMLRSTSKAHTIGGPPQVVKVYQYSDCVPLGVWWPDRAEGFAHLQGRKCFGYERTERFFLDPDTLYSSRLTNVRSDERSPDRSDAKTTATEEDAPK